jgi:uncharacterized protein YjbJ (UPF0337 family)
VVDRSYLGAKLDGRIIPEGRKPGTCMNHDRIEGRWKQFKGKVKEQWGKLTDDDLDVIAGRRDQLLGRIQRRHGLARDEANRQLNDWERVNPDFRFDDANTTDKTR